jgi:hypothetical protein
MVLAWQPCSADWILQRSKKSFVPGLDEELLAHASVSL